MRGAMDTPLLMDYYYILLHHIASDILPGLVRAATDLLIPSSIDAPATGVGHAPEPSLDRATAFMTLILEE